jgi:hypothetical protein
LQAASKKTTTNRLTTAGARTMNRRDHGVAHYVTKSGDLGFAAIRIWCF